MADDVPNGAGDAEEALGNIFKERSLGGANNGRPRSIESKNPVYLRFINRTSRCIEIFWINYRGVFVRYSLLRGSSTFVDINTFETNPWLALDQGTKDVMRIDRKPIYFPRRAASDTEPRNPNIRFPILPASYRQICHVTLPMYSLRERCLLQVRNQLRTEVDVAALHLPERLGADLRRLLALRERVKNEPLLY